MKEYEMNARVSGTIKALDVGDIVEIVIQEAHGPLWRSILSSEGCLGEVCSDQTAGKCICASKIDRIEAHTRTQAKSRILAAIQPDPEPKPVACLECGDTGMRDTGGVHPWGEHISVPCDCTPSSAGTVSVEAAKITPVERLFLIKIAMSGSDADFRRYRYRFARALRALAGDKP